MSNLDVVQLDREELVKDTFPASPRADFRLYFAPQAHKGIIQHAQQDTSVEICGVLVGQWRTDEHGPYAVVENYIKCDSATSKFAEVTFTHESWSQINQEMDTTYEDKRIVGWYHSHPDFGIFLSDRDCFIHEHFFSGAGQVAFVVDPVRNLEGAFAWKHGKPTPMSHYWIGDTIRTVQASTSDPASEVKRRNTGEADGNSTAAGGGYADGSALSPITAMLLPFVALFLLGYVLATMQDSWKRQAIIDGVVAQYTDFRLLKVGLREELSEMQQKLSDTTQLLQAMPEAMSDTPEEQQQELAETRKLIVRNLQEIQTRLAMASDRYGFSDDERIAIMRLQRRIEAQLRKSLEQQSASAEKAVPVSRQDDDPSQPQSEQADSEPPPEPDTQPPPTPAETLDEPSPIADSQ